MKDMHSFQNKTFLEMTAS